MLTELQPQKRPCTNTQVFQYVIGVVGHLFWQLRGGFETEAAWRKKGKRGVWIDFLFFQRWVSNRRPICFKLLSNLPDLGGAYCRFKSRLNWRRNCNFYYNKRQALNCSKLTVGRRSRSESIMKLPPWSGCVALHFPHPPSPPHSPSSALKASMGACETGLPVLGWMQPRIC